MPSIIAYSMSGSPETWSKRRSNTPSRAQRRNRLKLLFQLPNSEGRSRHGEPVRTRRNTASKTCVRRCHTPIRRFARQNTRNPQPHPVSQSPIRKYINYSNALRQTMREFWRWTLYHSHAVLPYSLEGSPSMPHIHLRMKRIS